LARLGKPKSQKYDGVYKTIIYPQFNLAIKMEKRVVIYINAVKAVPSSKPPAEEAKEE